MTPLLEIRGLSISYASRRGPIPAVEEFDLCVHGGETHGLVGESGCGKSSVAFAIMRHLAAGGRVAGGQILFRGRDLLSLSDAEMRGIRGGAIAMVYQEAGAALNPAMRIERQLIEVPMNHGVRSRSAAAAAVRGMLERLHLGDLDRILRSYPHQLSGGQQQRIVIAMALLANPELLLLDEPTTALDVTVEAGIVALVREISAQFGTAMLFISHNLGLVRETCERVTVMYAGRAIEVGPIKQVFERMHHPYTRGLFAAIPTLDSDKERRPLVGIPGWVPAPGARPPGCAFGPRCGSFLAGCCDLAVPSMQMAGADHATRCARALEISADAGMADAMVRPRGAIGDVLLAVVNLCKRYGAATANEQLSFAAHRGETVAIVGESGSGKSTLARVLMGLTAATSGSIRLAGEELSRLPVTRRSRATLRSLQMVFQSPFDTLNPSLTIGVQIERAIRKFGAERDEAGVRGRMFGLLDLVKLPREVAGVLPRQLSGGQKQRVAIARAFAGSPTLVVADEPLSALDVSVQAAVVELLIDVQRRERTTLLFISHDLAVVRYLAERIVVMYGGRIMEQGRTDEVFAPPYHPYTEALLAAMPVADPRVMQRRLVLGGDAARDASAGKGCVFAARCGYRLPGICESTVPPLQAFGPTHAIACHLPSARLRGMAPVFAPAAARTRLDLAR